ncbi:MAG: PH domain-containing protein [Chloroflexota bacterium]
MEHGGGRPLDRRARTLWRIEAVLGGIPALAVALAAGWLVRVGSTLPGWAAAVPAAAALAWTAWQAGPGTELRWRWWRWSVERDEIDLASGWFTRRRTLIPMARVQHVDTTTGPVERRLGLATVVLYTAAGASVIPALAEEEAAAVRDRIAALANLERGL